MIPEECGFGKERKKEKLGNLQKLGEGVTGSFAVRKFLEIRMVRDAPQEYVYEYVMY